MQNQKQNKLFAFKLAEQRDQKAQQVQQAQQWKVRDGVSVAGCTLVDPDGGLYRNTDPFGDYDGGIYC